MAELDPLWPIVGVLFEDLSSDYILNALVGLQSATRPTFKRAAKYRPSCISWRA